MATLKYTIINHATIQIQLIQFTVNLIHQKNWQHKDVNFQSNKSGQKQENHKKMNKFKIEHFLTEYFFLPSW